MSNSIKIHIADYLTDKEYIDDSFIIKIVCNNNNDDDDCRILHTYDPKRNTRSGCGYMGAYMPNSPLNYTLFPTTITISSDNYTPKEIYKKFFQLFGNYVLIESGIKRMFKHIVNIDINGNPIRELRNMKSSFYKSDTLWNIELPTNPGVITFKSKKSIFSLTIPDQNNKNVLLKGKCMNELLAAINNIIWYANRHKSLQLQQKHRPFYDYIFISECILSLMINIFKLNFLNKTRLRPKENFEYVTRNDFIAKVNESNGFKKEYKRSKKNKEIRQARRLLKKYKLPVPDKFLIDIYAFRSEFRHRPSYINAHFMDYLSNDPPFLYEQDENLFWEKLEFYVSQVLNDFLNIKANTKDLFTKMN